MTQDIGIWSAAALLCIFPVSLHAQQPEWASLSTRSAAYPESIFLTGFGVAGFENDAEEQQAVERATAVARRNLIEKIRITVRSTVIARTEENTDQIRQSFSATTETETALDLEGLTDTHGIDTDARQAYALAVVRRESLLRTYENRLARIQTDLEMRIMSGRTAAARGDHTRALREYLRAEALLRQRDEAREILNATAGTANAYADHARTAGSPDSIADQIAEAISGVLSRPIITLEDAVGYLTYCLLEQKGQHTSSLVVKNPTYRDTPFGSPFARYLKGALESRLALLGGWNIVTYDRLATDQEPGPDTSAELETVYWDRTDGVKIVTVVRDGTLGVIVASAEVNVPLSAIREAGVALLPENLRRVEEDDRRFWRDEVLTGGLELEVRTNKGSHNPVFVKGERMRVYLKVNMPSAIRFVYHLADGNRALLLDNFRIEGDSVGREIEVPQEFECDAPFGPEVLQVFATTGTFPPVQTRQQDGYDMLSGTLDGFLTATRGASRGNTTTLQTERRIVLTTMAE